MVITKALFPLILALPALMQAQNSSGLAQTDSKYYFFGDSLTDTGNLGRLIGELGPGYPEFSVSNGPTWPIYLVPDVIGFSETVLDPTLSPRFSSVDFAVATSTTSTLAISQTGEPFTEFRAQLEITPNDLAFVWAGANDLIPLARTVPLPASGIFDEAVSTATDNLQIAVSNLHLQGIENIAVISLANPALAVGITNFDSEGSRVTRLFNEQLRQKLATMPDRPNLLWIDSDALLNDAVTHPSAFGLTNITDSIAPQAGEGIPTTLSPEEQEGYLFFDDIHPSTAVHRQFATYVAHHLKLGKDARAAFLVTDALLGFDDRFGFESPDLEKGHFDFKVSTSTLEARSRSTQSIRGDFDFAVTDHFQLGGEFLYAEGDSGPSDFDAFGFGLDAILNGQAGPYLWEVGLGIGYLNGDLDRDYRLGTFTASGEHEATLFTLHTALRKDKWTLAGIDGYWELGLKQRFAHRSSATETGAASLNLHYDSELLSTTIANIEMGFDFSRQFRLEMALNPVLYHHGGEISARQAEGLAGINTPDLSNYDAHTARASLFFSPTEASTLSATFAIGTDDFWSGSLGYQIRF